MVWDTERLGTCNDFGYTHRKALLERTRTSWHYFIILHLNLAVQYHKPERGTWVDTVQSSWLFVSNQICPFRVFALCEQV